MLILAYHSISSQRTDDLAIHPRQFGAQLDWLRRNYKSVPLSEAVAAYLHGAPTGKLAAITFDDGMRDNYTEAFPVLRAAGMTATIFVSIDAIESGMPFRGGENLSKNANLRPEDLLPLTWGQIREMQQAGISFGSHTFAHPRLPRLGDVDLSREIAGSKRFLENKLQVPVPFFCYPFGDFDERVKQTAIAAGYLAAFVTPPRPLSSEDAYSIRRVGVYRSNSLLELRLKASPFGRKLHHLVRRFRTWRAPSRPFIPARAITDDPGDPGVSEDNRKTAGSL
jgi:peptidoglycan/xylan/chitin deacetylase (PgdA/CDA1 family)